MPVYITTVHIHGVHCAGLSAFFVRGATLRHFSRQVAQLFRGKFRRQNECPISLRSEHPIYIYILVNPSFLVDGIVRGLTKIYVPWWCKRASRLMTEAARERSTKRKIKILTHQWVIRKVMLLHFCLVMSCPCQLLEVSRSSLNFWKNMYAN
jgi:hypothetical protein